MPQLPRSPQGRVHGCGAHAVQSGDGAHAIDEALAVFRKLAR